MRVLHVVTSDAYAGLERHVVQLARELQRLGCDAPIACPPSANVMRGNAAALGIAVHPARHRLRAPWPVAIAGSVGDLTPDLVHVHDGSSTAVGVLLARRWSCPLVRTQHFVRPASVERRGWRGTASRAAQRVMNRAVRGYIGVSRAALKAVEARGETGRALVTVIPPGVDPASEAEAAKAEAWRRIAEKPVVAYIGRHEPEKRLEVLLEAIPQVLQAVPACRFVVAGGGSVEAELRQRARQLRIDDAIEWPGWISDPGAVLGRCHLYVNTWPWEGFGMAMAEAMTFGVPVIAPDSGASPELIEPGVNGVVVPAADPAALAAAVVHALRDADTLATMGRAARRHALERFGADVTGARTLAFYRDLTPRAP